MTQTEVSLLVATVGPIVYDREKCLRFVEWASAQPSDGASAPEVEAVFHTYLAWNIAVEAVRKPGDRYSSDELRIPAKPIGHSGRCRSPVPARRSPGA